MSDNIINYREYVRHAGKYLKPGVFEVVGRDCELRVTVERLSDVSSLSETVKYEESVYGCGCKRGLIKHCNKHGVE